MSTNVVGVLSLISLLLIFGTICYHVWDFVGWSWLRKDGIGILILPVIYLLLPLYALSLALQISGNINKWWDKKKNPEKYEKMDEVARLVEEYPNIVLNGFKSLIDPHKILWAQSFDIAVDTSTCRTVAAYPTEDKKPIFSEIEIIDVNLQAIIEKNVQRNESSIKRGLLGWAIAGPVGGVIGSGMGSGFQPIEATTGYELKLYTDNLNNPLHVVQFVDKNIAEEWEALFKAIQFKQKYLQNK